MATGASKDNRFRQPARAQRIAADRWAKSSVMLPYLNTRLTCKARLVTSTRGAAVLCCVLVFLGRIG